MKSIYNKSNHSFQEQSLMKKEICILGVYPCTVAGRKICECKEYNDHIATLRTIPCRPGDFWEEGKLYEEGKDYVIGEGIPEDWIPSFISPPDDSPMEYYILKINT